jgi:hypothetical protein
MSLVARENSSESEALKIATQAEGKLQQGGSPITSRF